MKKWIAVYVVLKLTLAAGLLLAAPAEKLDTADACRAVLEENFNAFNYENSDALVATISPAAERRPGQIEEFRREAEKLFEEEDVYIKLVLFEVIAQRGDRLLGRVVQTTIKKGDEDGTSTLNHIFRHRSALLPMWRNAEYKQEFIWDSRQKKWLLGAIIGRPLTVANPKVYPPRLKYSGGENACKDGRCNNPLVRVQMR